MSGVIKIFEFKTEKINQETTVYHIILKIFNLVSSESGVAIESSRGMKLHICYLIQVLDL